MPYNPTAQLSRLEQLRISDGDGSRYTGGSQEWYATAWQRRAGCGPTAGANLFWYLSRTRDSCAALCAHDASRKIGFQGLMEDVWSHITPGNMGVNSAELFTRGARSYAEQRGVALDAQVLEVPVLQGKRPPAGELADFLQRHLGADRPVAFLNLSNGSLQNLESWHWVTLVSVDGGALEALMYDQGCPAVIDLGLWLRTTALGGAFVALVPSAEGTGGEGG